MSVPNAGASGSGARPAPAAPAVVAPVPGTGVGGARVIMGGATGPNKSISSLNAIQVNLCQKGNPVIAHIRGVAWEFGDIQADYQVGATTGVLYLSLRYHLLHPEYIHGRIEKLGRSFSLRIMLIQCDVDNHAAAIKELTKVCIINEFTMMVAFSTQEAGRYLEIYKQFERKPPDMIKERVENDHMAHLNAALTSVKGINKTDVMTLASNFGSFKSIVTANAENLVECPGLGEKKVKRLREACTAPFSSKGLPKKKSRAEVRGEEGNALN